MIPGRASNARSRRGSSPLRLSHDLESGSATLLLSFLSRRRLAGVVFSAITIAACVLVGRRLTHTSWPLAHAKALLVAIAAMCYFVSFVVRARGWHRLFPAEQQPDQARCLASVGAGAASGA